MENGIAIQVEILLIFTEAGMGYLDGEEEIIGTIMEVTSIFPRVLRFLILPIHLMEAEMMEKLVVIIAKPQSLL